VIEVIERTAADVVWPFEQSGSPYVVVGRPRGSRTTVDPFPAYPHDAEQIGRYLDLAGGEFPVGWPLSAYVLHQETTARTNGWAQPGDYDYSGEKDARGHYPRTPCVVFPAKRIPPHPAMTRYVAVHEYGHIVEAWIVYCRTSVSEKFEDKERELTQEYAALRGFTEGDVPYGGGNWHKTLGEVFANDFRILICGVEAEYWPHPGIPRPNEIPGLKKWWRAAQRKYAHQNTPESV
jgi:hypothetical protein